MVGVVGSSPIAPTKHKPLQVTDLQGFFGFYVTFDFGRVEDIWSLFAHPAKVCD
jgi:hypothetical protein